MERIKVAFSGTHGTGKSTSVFELAKQHKINYPGKSVAVLMEVARHSPRNINTSADELSQMWIFSEQLRKEIFFQTNYEIVICDRSIFDSIAYSRVLGFNSLADSLLELGKHFADTYTSIIVKTMESCPFLHDDGVRDTQNTEFRKLVQLELLDIYKHLLDSGSKFQLTII